MDPLLRSLAVKFMEINSLNQLIKEEAIAWFSI